MLNFCTRALPVILGACIGFSMPRPIAVRGPAPGVDWERCSKQMLHLQNSNLTDANLKGAYLTGTTLSGSKLAGADLSDSELVRTSFQNADLSGANFEKALAHRASFAKCIAGRTHGFTKRSSSGSTWTKRI
jgi:uncharacterized protein YjbI with pentapeptide repeats